MVATNVDISSLHNGKTDGTISLTDYAQPKSNRIEGLFRRIRNFSSGHRYVITFTAGENPDWTVVDMGKVER